MKALFLVPFMMLSAAAAARPATFAALLREYEGKPIVLGQTTGDGPVRGTLESVAEDYFCAEVAFAVGDKPQQVTHCIPFSAVNFVAPGDGRVTVNVTRW